MSHIYTSDFHLNIFSDVTYVIKYSEVSEFQDKHEKKELALKKIDVKLNDLVVEALKKEQIEHTTNVVVVHQDAKQNLGCHMKEFLFSLDEPFIISKSCNNVYQHHAYCSQVKMSYL